MNMQAKMKVSDVDDASLLKLFIGLRDRRAKRKAAYEADDAGDKDKQYAIEIEFLRRFDERGIDNVSSREYGTAYRSTRSSSEIICNNLLSMSCEYISVLYSSSIVIFFILAALIRLKYSLSEFINPVDSSPLE